MPQTIKMKKYLTLLPAIAAIMLSSCSNDDIPTGQAITFNINPETVVSGLVEYTAGDLTSLDDDEELYVSLYVYNDAGVLVATDTQTFNDYTHKMKSVQSIGAGEYTVVASTQIIRNGDFRYWNFSGEKNLTTFTVTDAGYIGGYAKILGLSASKIRITEASKDININVECAGAVALVRVMNWNRYNNVTIFGLMSNKSCDNAHFDSRGQLDYSIETKSDYSYWMNKWEYDSNYKGAYGYTFMFPYTNIKMSFVAISTSESRYYLGQECLGDIRKGYTYYFSYDVTSEETEWTEYTSEVGRPAAPQEKVVEADGLLFDTGKKQIKIAR